MDDKNQYQIKDLLKAMLKQYRLEDQYDEFGLLRNWPDIMGKMIANHTTKLSIRDKKLIIVLDSPVLRQELSYGKQVIVEKVNAFTGQELITDVVIR